MTRQQPAEIRRAAILDAASEVLLRQGLDGMSMDGVATAAGIAKGTVYLYFPSKSDLLAGLRTRYGDSLAKRATTAIRTVDTSDPSAVIAGFQRVVRELVDYLMANRSLHRTLFQVAGVSEEETLEALRVLVRDYLKMAMDAGGIDQMDADLLMRFLLDGIHGALLPLFRAKRANADETVAELGQLIERLLSPSDSQRRGRPQPTKTRLRARVAR